MKSLAIAYAARRRARTGTPKPFEEAADEVLMEHEETLEALPDEAPAAPAKPDIGAILKKHRFFASKNEG